MFGPMIVLGDAATCPRRWSARWKVYAGLGGLTATYLLLRWVALDGFPLPAPPYAHSPGEPGFVRFVADKLVYYVLGLFAYFPIVGFAGLRGLRQQPALFYGLFLAIVLGGSVVLAWSSRRRVLLTWLGMSGLALLPVLPVFASSHHLYLPSAGMVIAFVTLAHRLADRGRHLTRGPGRWLGGVVGVVCGVHLIGFAGANVVYDVGAAGYHAAGQLAVDDVARSGRDIRPHDTLLFINLPMLSFNCVPGIEEAMNVAPLRGYVLTLAPPFLGMDRPTRVEQVGTHELRVRLDEGAYFSGMIGEQLLAAAGRDEPFAPHERFSTEDFDVEIIAVDEAGVRELAFRFPRPLDDRSYHFFLGSPRFAAYPLDWSR